MTERIYFQGLIVKVQTMADGGTRMTVDIPETELPESVRLFALATVPQVVFFEVRTEPEK